MSKHGFLASSGKEAMMSCGLIVDGVVEVVRIWRTTQ
jgi:hypothetical protein